MYVMVRFGALSVAFALAACSFSRAAPLHGTVFEPARAAPPFSLIDQNGAPFASSQLAGSAVALFFGFTHCSDVCPETLRRLRHASQLAAAPKPVRIVMITVDRKRDTPAALRAFFARSGVSATGLTGTASSLRNAYRTYGIAIVPQRGDLGHTDTVFLIDPHGKLREAIDPATPVSQLASDLRGVAK